MYGPLSQSNPGFPSVDSSSSLDGFPGLIGLQTAPQALNRNLYVAEKAHAIERHCNDSSDASHRVVLQEILDQR